MLKSYSRQLNLIILHTRLELRYLNLECLAYLVILLNKLIDTVLEILVENSKLAVVDGKGGELFVKVGGELFGVGVDELGEFDLEGLLLLAVLELG